MDNLKGLMVMGCPKWFTPCSFLAGAQNNASLFYFQNSQTAQEVGGKQRGELEQNLMVK